MLARSCEIPSRAAPAAVPRMDARRSYTPRGNCFARCIIHSFAGEMPERPKGAPC